MPRELQRSFGPRQPHQIEPFQIASQATLRFVPGDSFTEPHLDFFEITFPFGQGQPGDPWPMRLGEVTKMNVEAIHSKK